MALKITIIKNIFEKDIELKDVYVKIESILGTKENIVLYVTETVNGTNVENVIYTIKPTMKDNFFQQGYEYLKTLPKYIDSIDC